MLVSFGDLPTEVVQLIASCYLAPADAAALLCTSSALHASATTVWCVKIEQLAIDYRAKYGDPSSKSTAEWREIFDTEHKFNGKVSCTTAGIMHGNNPSYWAAHRANEASIFGEVAYCRQVCWLDVNVSATLPRGRYAVSWSVDSAGEWGREPVSFSVRTKDAEAGVCPPDLVQTPAEMRAALGESASDGWSRLPAGILEVTSLAAEVKARIWKHSSSWMGPVMLDYVHFHRVA